MSIKRPTFKVNTNSSRRSIERKTVFYDLKPDTKTRMRILPPVTQDGNLFTKVTNHFKLKNEDNFGIALACLDEHGDAEVGTDCFLCKASKELRNSPDAQDKKVAADIRPSPRWYIQALIWDAAEEKYFGPKLVGLSKTTAEALSNLLVDQGDSGDAFFCDETDGQDIYIRRTGAGLKTKYSVTLSGNKSPLDVDFPGWEDQIITDIVSALELKVENAASQQLALKRSYPDLVLNVT